ncbi:MAG: nicotinate phosphoribosyltransferase [Chloroflexi bacterium]|nr:nicotinate phosphoribosyltransferase [Chloroflexota bacterium]
MSLFDGQRRWDPDLVGLDVDGLRRGRYADKYFVNIARLLTDLAREGYVHPGHHARVDPQGLAVGDARVEMQVFTRRPGRTVVAGLDAALAVLRAATGTWQGDAFVPTADHLQVWAVEDGEVAEYHGDPTQVQPALRIRGRYRDFAALETTILGYLTRGSRIATNTYEVLKASRGKPVLFFPARFDLPATQALDGYAYWIGVQRYNHDHGTQVRPFISTDAQGAWWGGAGGGTTAHALIACFLGDTPEAMLQFAAHLPPQVPRIALVDFNNRSAAESVAVAEVLFRRYWELLQAGDQAEARKFVLFGVRLDTAGNLRDESIPLLGDPALDFGVQPRLVVAVREALDHAWQAWDLPLEARAAAREYLRAVKIVVSGGFGAERIDRFERLGVPVDFYGVGSWFFRNAGPTLTDFTADVVRVQVGGRWVDMAKVGRRACEHPRWQRVTLEPVA